jgi:DNA-binding response OmpR family regulator
VRGKRILIVDDDEDMRCWMRLAVERLGAVVREAATGSGALRWLADEGPFDLVITDVRIPLPDGIEVLARARSLGIDSPFLVITAFSDRALRERVAGFTASTVLDKPFAMEELHTVVVALLAGPPEAA